VPFFSISGSDFVEMFVGVGASRVRDLFKQAKDNSPCIIFLDEIDAVGRRRGAGLGGGHDEREQTLNAILVEMDGFETDTGIIVIAATNRPDVLDPALLRPGRFDRQITIDLPDLKGREEILGVHARKVRLGPSVDLKVLARGTPMFSGADLAATINEAALVAVMRNREAVGMDELEEARDKVLWGRQKKSRVMAEEDRRTTAYHEAGHALVATLLEEAEPLHKVTIVPRGRALGATMQLPEQDRYTMQRRRLLAMLTMLYAGRIAEDVFCGDISSGAQDDIKRATDLAHRMVCEWGMSEEIGPINYSDSEETLFLGREVTKTKSHSDETSVTIDKEVRRLLLECYQRAEILIKDHRGEMERITQGLLKYEVLSRAEVDKLIGGTPVEDLRPKAEDDEPAEPESTAAASEEAKADEAAEEMPDDRDLESEGRFAY
jgi:cell division protease FtsH